MKTSAIFGFCGILALAGVPAAMSDTTPAPSLPARGAAYATAYDAATGKTMADAEIQVYAVATRVNIRPLTFITNKTGHAMLGPLDKGSYRASIVYHNIVASDVVTFTIGDTDCVPEVILFFRHPKLAN